MRKLFTRMCGILHPRDVTWLGRKSVFRRTEAVLLFTVVAAAGTFVADGISGILMGVIL